MSYKVKLDIFEGPLDLLLYLIKKDDLDITNIPILKITEQYMQYIDLMKMLDLDLVGDFLVMAATLMQIKSRMLLPPDPVEVEQEEEDPLDELARRLLEYKKFKEIAGKLEEHETLRKDFFTRKIDEEGMDELKNDAKEVFFEANLFDLINAFSEALQRAPEQTQHEILREEFTVEQKIHDILHLLLAHNEVELKTLFIKAQHKSEIIVTFLAVLELIRLQEIKAMQNHAFADIKIMRNKENIVPVAETETGLDGDQLQESIEEGRSTNEDTQNKDNNTES